MMLGRTVIGRRKCLVARLGRGLAHQTKCLDRQTKSTLPSLSKSQPMLRFSSSSGGMEQEEYIDYLLPQAYRIDDNRNRNGYGTNSRHNNNGQNSNRNKGASSLQQNRRHSPRVKGWANNSSPIINRWRRSLAAGRRNVSPGKRGSSNIKANDSIPDIKSIRQIENTLSVKMNEYTSRLGGVSSVSSLGSSADTGENNSNGEAGSIPSNLLGPSNSDDFQNNGIDIDTIYASEESYQEIVSLSRSLVIGWAGIAGSISDAKRREHFDGNNEPAVSVTDYEEAVMRAEHHLESFEAIFRNRVNIVSRGKSMLLEEQNNKGNNAGHGKDDKQLLGKLTSMFGDFFASNASPDEIDWDQTLKRTDGKAVLKVGETETQSLGHPTVADFDAILESHQNIDPDLNTSMYEHVLVANHSAYSFGKDVNEASTQRSNRLLNRWISVYCLAEQNSAATKDCDAKSNTNSDREASERRLFHTVIRQNVDLGTVDGVQRAEDWLVRMRHLKEMGGGHCMPDVETYNLVLIGFCNLSKQFLEDRKNPIFRFIFDGVERILMELVESKGEGPRPDIMSLNLALNAISKAGRGFKWNLCERTNSLVFKVIGEKLYRDKIVGIENNMDETADGGDEKLSSTFSHKITSSEVGSVDLKNPTQLYVEPDLDTYHWLVGIYCQSGKLPYIKQGMVLLKMMIQARMEEDSNSSINQDRFNNAPASFAPSTGTHNNVLRALAKTRDELSEFSDSGYDTTDHVAGARVVKEITGLFDSMVQYGTSIPNHATFLLALHTCQKTKSPEAGDLAEEILSRMEIVETYQPELRSLSHAYSSALECWLTAAHAGRSGAAERAFRLFEVMDAQAGRDRPQLSDQSLEGGEADAFDRFMLSHGRIHFKLMKICAANSDMNNHDSRAAMVIAFQVYDRMIQDKFKLNPKIFEMMYTCVRNYLDHHPEEERQGLLQKVFGPASKHGITRGELLGRHKQSQRKGNLAVELWRQ